MELKDSCWGPHQKKKREREREREKEKERERREVWRYKWSEKRTVKALFTLALLKRRSDGSESVTHVRYGQITTTRPIAGGIAECFCFAFCFLERGGAGVIASDL